MRYFLLVPAFILDSIQMLAMAAFFALQFVTPVGGGATGAIGAAWYCFKTSTGIWESVKSAAECGAGGALVGAGMSAFAVPIGIVFDVVLSLTAGVIILIGLATMGMFYPRIVVSRFLFEAAPFFGFLPMWTNMVWASIKQKEREEAGETETDGLGSLGGRLIGAASLMVPGGPLVKGAVHAAQRRYAEPSTPTESAERGTPAPARFTDVRPKAPANDNAPQPYANAA